MEIDVDVQGLSAVERKLKLLPDRLGNNAMRRALRKGANVIRNEARNNAKRFDDPQTREQIWKNVIVASGGRRRERRAGGVMMRVGVAGGAKTGTKLTYSDNKTNRKKGIVGQEYSLYHWRFLEFGTSTMQAQPFMRPAMGKAQAAADAITKDMLVQVDQEIAKLNSQIVNTGG